MRLWILLYLLTVALADEDAEGLNNFNDVDQQDNDDFGPVFPFDAFGIGYEGFLKNSPLMASMNLKPLMPQNIPMSDSTTQVTSATFPSAIIDPSSTDERLYSPEIDMPTTNEGFTNSPNEDSNVEMADTSISTTTKEYIISTAEGYTPEPIEITEILEINSKVADDVNSNMTDGSLTQKSGESMEKGVQAAEVEKTEFSGTEESHNSQDTKIEPSSKTPEVEESKVSENVESPIIGEEFQQAYIEQYVSVISSKESVPLKESYYYRDDTYEYTDEVYDYQVFSKDIPIIPIPIPRSESAVEENTSDKNSEDDTKKHSKFKSADSKEMEQTSHAGSSKQWEAVDTSAKSKCIPGKSSECVTNDASKSSFSQVVKTDESVTVSPEASKHDSIEKSKSISVGELSSKSTKMSEQEADGESKSTSDIGSKSKESQSVSAKASKSDSGESTISAESMSKTPKSDLNSDSKSTAPNSSEKSLQSTEKSKSESTENSKSNSNEKLESASIKKESHIKQESNEGIKSKNESTEVSKSDSIDQSKSISKELSSSKDISSTSTSTTHKSEKSVSEVASSSVSKSSFVSQSFSKSVSNSKHSESSGSSKISFSASGTAAMSTSFSMGTRHESESKVVTFSTSGSELSREDEILAIAMEKEKELETATAPKNTRRLNFDSVKKYIENAYTELARLRKRLFKRENVLNELNEVIHDLQTLCNVICASVPDKYMMSESDSNKSSSKSTSK